MGLKKKELIKLLNNYKLENELLLETINEIKKMEISSVIQEVIIYRDTEEMTKKEKRKQLKINYLKKRFKITKNIIYQNELDRTKNQHSY
jgi:hypothetical protein